MRGKFSVNLQKVYVRGDLSLEFRNLGSCYVIEVEDGRRRHKVYFGREGDVRRVDSGVLTSVVRSVTAEG